MIGVLPKSLTLGEKQYPIRTDFRVALRIFEAFDDKTLTAHEQAYICLKNIFYEPESIPDELLQQAVERAYWFLGGGDMPSSQEESVKLLDWKQDEGILFPAVNKSAGFEVRECEYLHWWTFLGFFSEIGEGLFTSVMSIRQKRARGKPLEKYEKEFYIKNKHLINIRSAEDDEAMDELNGVLSVLI